MVSDNAKTFLSARKLIETTLKDSIVLLKSTTDLVI